MSTPALKYHSNNFFSKRKNGTLLVFASFFFLLLLIATIISVNLAQRQQDIRQQAFNPTGVVEISYQTPSTIIVGQPNTITFTINTNGVNLLASQLIFQMQGSFAQPPTASMSGIPDPYLDISTVTALQNTSGYQVALGVVNSTQPISLPANTQYATVTFTPLTPGPITLEFANFSSALRFDNQLDELRTLQTFVLQATATATPTLTATGQPTTTPTTQPTVTTQPTSPVTGQPTSVVSGLPTSTPTGLPRAGNSGPTMIIFSAGLSALLLGFWTLRKR